MKSVDIDALLQDSWLLVVEVNRIDKLKECQQLWRRCLELVETLRERLREAGLSQRSMDLISHAQSALLDETVLGHSEGSERDIWLKEPLQARLFNAHQAGESLYEQIREVLREPSPNPHVLTAFHRVLMLGFKGRYQIDDPEREQLLANLTALVPPLRSDRVLLGRGSGRHTSAAWRYSPWRHALLVGVLLSAVWWGLDLALGDLLETLLPGQA